MHGTSSGHAALLSNTTHPVAPKEDLARVEKDFFQVFGDLQPDLRLISYFVCDYHKHEASIVYKGKLYISERHLCFYSPSKSFRKVILFSDIINIVKKNVAMVFANAIGVSHPGGSELFTSFENRDRAFESIIKVWNQRRIKKTSRTKNLIKQESRASKPGPSSSFGDIFALDEDDGFEEPIPEIIDLASVRNENRLNLSKSMQLPAANDDLVLMRQRSSAHHPSEPRDEPNSDVSKEQSKRMSLDVSKLKSMEPLQPMRKQVASFGSKDDLTLHWEDAKKQNTNEILIPDQKDLVSSDVIESKAEPSEEEVNGPSGTFTNHVQITNPPTVTGIFLGTSCKKLYTKIMSNQKFWEYTLKEQENKKVVVSELLPSSDHPDVMYQRECRFISPIKGAPMGPKETRVIQDHRVSMPTENEMILDTVTKSLDIPVYGDSFVVQTFWKFVNDGDDCKLTIRWKVHFLKSVWVKGLIEKNAKTATEEALRGWIVLAKKWLQEEKELSSSNDNTTENNVLFEKNSLKFDSLDESDLILEKETRLSSTKELGFLDTNFEVPIIEIQVPVKFILLLSVLISFMVCGGFLFSHIYTLESEVKYWEDSTHEIEERLLFLNLFASHLVDYVSDHQSSLEDEWEYWRRTRGLDWRLAEWQDQMFVLQAKLSGALTEVSHILDNVSAPHRERDPDKLLNERKLRNLVNFIDSTKPFLHDTEVSGSFPWGLTIFFLSVVVCSALCVIKFLL